MKKSNEASLGEVIKAFLKAYRMEDKISEVRIHAMWEKLMGAEINRLTQNISLKDKVLVVYLRSAALRGELSMAKSKIIDMINKEMQSEVIKEIIFR